MRISTLKSQYKKLLEDQSAIQNDLLLAQNIQQNFLLEEVPPSNSWEVAYKFRPVAGVSGDIYDFYHDKNGELSALSIFDVSGHGVSSGLITMLVKMIAFQKYKKFLSGSLVEMAVDLNKDITSQIENLENYVTGIVMRIFDDKIQYVNCGHCDVLLKSARTGNVRLALPDTLELSGGYKGDILGYSMNTVVPKLVNFKVESGDIVLLYTDGLFDNLVREDISLSLHEFVQMFSNIESNDPEVITEQLLCNVNSTKNEKSNDSCNERDFRDDVTLICMKKK